MADFIAFNQGKTELASNGLPATCYFLLSTKDCNTHLATDTLAGGGRRHPELREANETEQGPGGRMIDHQTAVVSVSSATDNEIVAAVTGKRIVVLGYQLSNGAASAQAVTWKTGSTAKTGAMSLPSSVGGSLTAPVTSHNRAWFAGAPGEALNLTLSQATSTTGVVVYKLA